MKTLLTLLRSFLVSVAAGSAEIFNQCFNVVQVAVSSGLADLLVNTSPSPRRTPFARGSRCGWRPTAQDSFASNIRNPPSQE